MAEDPRKSLKNIDVVLTTYGMLLRQKWMLDMDWDRVILDEAQAIKNPTARQTRAVKKLESEARIALTGTPVENRLSELWSIMQFLNPGFLGSQAGFRNIEVARMEAPVRVTETVSPGNLYADAQGP